MRADLRGSRKSETSPRACPPVRVLCELLINLIGELVALVQVTTRAVEKKVPFLEGPEPFQRAAPSALLCVFLRSLWWWGLAWAIRWRKERGGCCEQLRLSKVTGLGLASSHIEGQVRY